MIAWIAKRVLRRPIERLNAGDPGPMLRMFRKDAVDEWLAARKGSLPS